ncbi:S8 family serine peptidase [Pseudoalteromonas tunicata]|uniref:S8 family peptidase n=1 Tax=Pseudoalteromonas tunicata TaxID=314281 RepID=UPI00273D046B|nr:S8 family serine peptidase [Pseudoalteromonas tunicata]MDP5215487.1 S8 family serine peptidase [Pseudoalteromonas tunicata]
MSKIAKQGLFAVSLCALSVANALYATPNKPIQIDHEIPPFKKEAGIITHVYSETDKDGNVVAQKFYRQFEKERFIVELNDAPLVRAKKQIIKNVAKQYHRSSGSASIQQTLIRSQLQEAQATIESTQQATISQITSLDKTINILNRFSRTQNAIVIEADRKTIDAIEQLPHVKRVSRDTVISINLTESVSLINAPLVWALTDYNNQEITGKGVSVAILDTGIDYKHADLGGCIGVNCRITHGYDFVNNDNDPMDGHGHGTHVAGIVGANGTLKGVAPEVTFHAYKVLSDYGSGATSGIIAALERSVDPDGDINTDDAVDIVNMSLGGSGSPTSPLTVATNNTVDAGVIVVVAAGNDGTYGDINTNTPANAAKAITVASSTKSDQLSSFSSKATSSQLFNKPEITAPGSYIHSTMPNGNYAYMSGTSMAAPHVAGAIALLKQNDPTVTAQKATQLLAAGAVTLDAEPLAQGPGRMDIEKSIKATTTANTTALNFGKLNNESASWRSAQSLTIYNHSESEKNYQIAIGNGLPAGVELTTANSNITIAANSSYVLDFDLTVADTAAVPFATTSSGVHFSDITISSDTEQLRIPTYFEHSITLTLKTNSTIFVDINIINDQGVRSNFYIDANNPVEINSAGGRLWVSATYFGLDTSDIKSVPGINKNKVGVSSHLLELTEHTEFLFDIKKLKNITGLVSATGHNGDSMLSKAHNFYLHAEFLSKDGRGSGWGFPRETLTHQYIALGDMTDALDFTLASQFKFSESESETGFYLFNRKIIDGVSVANDIEIDLPALGAINILTPNPEKVNKFRIYDRNSRFHSLAVDPKIKKINIYQEQQNDFIDFKFFKTYYDDPVTYKRTNTIHSKHFDLNESGQLRTHHYNRATQTSSTNELNLSDTSRQYFNSTLYISDTNLDHVGSVASSYGLFAYGLFADNQENSRNSEATYHFYCENEAGSRELLSSGKVDYNNSTIDRPEANCHKFLYTLSYKNNFSDTSDTSTLTFYLAENDTVKTVDYLSLKHSNKLYIHNIVNKIDSTLTLEQSGSLNLKSVEMRLGNNDWQLLESTLDEDNLVTFPLDLIEGSHEADIRITSTSSMGHDVTHTLNNYFTFGTTAGDINDADDDGIANDQDTDDDNDGYNDDIDAFPYNSQEWLDTDNDSIGNNADLDDDNDGYLDNEDAFPLDATEWLDTDGDGTGNNTDTDDDNDGHLDTEDVFPLDANEWVDTDNDGIGNNTDIDDDNDGYLDDDDAFPLDKTEWLDTDGDGLGNNADSDDDNDGVSDNDDAFPLDATESADTDGDGIGNNVDSDDDNDGVSDNDDAFPLDATESVDTDGDGIGNNADSDDDNDGVSDSNDAFPLDATESVDTDGDGLGNNADSDDDNDGVSDNDDAFPLDATESVDTDGDGLGNNADPDDDNDGVSDNQDAYPLDASKSVLQTNNATNVEKASSGGSIPILGLFTLFLINLRRFRRK